MENITQIVQNLSILDIAIIIMQLLNPTENKLNNAQNIGGHGRTPRGESREGVGGVKIDFRKTSFLSGSRRNFFLKFQGGLQGSKNSVNLTFNAL